MKLSLNQKVKIIMGCYPYPGSTGKVVHTRDPSSFTNCYFVYTDKGSAWYSRDELVAVDGKDSLSPMELLKLARNRLNELTEERKALDAEEKSVRELVDTLLEVIEVYEKVRENGHI